MRIPSGNTTTYLYFVAVDATDRVTRETGLSSFTVARSRNGAADAAYTTPTITEIDNTAMPGVYALLIDEDTTIDSGFDEQEVVVHITHTGMAPVTRTFTLFRSKITAGNTLGVESDGDLTKVNTLDGHTAQTGDNYARLGAPAGASIAADIAAVDADVTTLLGRITATLFSGITSLAEWLGLIAGKQVGNTTARTELRATGAGSGTYDETTDSLEVAAENLALKLNASTFNAFTASGGSGLNAIPWNAAWDAEVQSEVADALAVYDPPTQTELVAAFTEIKGATWATTDTLEAIRDRGDAAWITATGFSTLSAADIRTAVGLASANLDTQLGSIATDADSAATDLTTLQADVTAILADTNELQTDWANGGRLDLLIDGILEDTGTTIPALFPANFSSLSISGGNIAGSVGSLASVANIFTTAMTEAYPTYNGTMTLAQGLYELRAKVGNFAISGTTKTHKKLDGTTAGTSTLDSSTTPTSITPAS